MTSNQWQLDLIVIVPDADMEATVKTLLFCRQKSLNMRTIQFEVKRHLQRDSGCRSDCHNYLRTWLHKSQYAMVLFDYEGCGREQTPRTELEKEIEERLGQNGWRDRCAVIIIDPELESWVWSDSPHVNTILGWKGNFQTMKSWLQNYTLFWTKERIKPEKPKEAMEAILRKVHKQQSSKLFEKLACKVSLDRCIDPSFQKFRDILHSWFPTKQ